MRLLDGLEIDRDASAGTDAIQAELLFGGAVLDHPGILDCYQDGQLGYRFLCRELDRVVIHCSNTLRLEEEKDGRASDGSSGLTKRW